MKELKGIILVVLFVVIIITINGSLFIITEGRQAIITQFGRPIGKPLTNAGLHTKIPFIQDVRYVDKRILTWDGHPNQIPTKDKKYIKVDTTARFRIVDALKFIQTVHNERGARARLDAILDASTRDVISNHYLVETVRNSNSILSKAQELKRKLRERRNQGDSIVEEEVSGEIEKILVGREELSKIIVSQADKSLTPLGIKLIDVQLRRISYEKSVEEKVFERMISERQRIAQKIRSIGQGEKAKIEGRLARDLKDIESKAYRESQLIRGKAEAKAIKIYAKSFQASPDFYKFLRSMEAYKNSFKDEMKFIISSNSEFFKYLKKD